MNIPRLPFLEVIKDASGGNKKTLQKDYLESGEFPIIDQGQKLIAGYTDDPERVCRVKPPVIVFGDHTRAVKYVDFPFAMGADGTKILVPKTESDTKYLYYAIRAINLENAGYSRHFKFLKETKIPLPPLPEQKRIAAILDAADALRAKRRESLAQLDVLLQSTFLEMFGDPVGNPKGWDSVKMGDLGEVITGNTPSRQHPEYYGDDIEWIKSDNINNPSFFLTEAEEGLSATGRKVARTAPENSILVTCIAGSPSCIGNAAIADREVAFNQQINAFVPGKRINLWYAFGLFLVGKQLIQNASTNSMKGMVSKSAFTKITIPLPPLELQQKFAIIVESVENQKKRYRTHLDELDALFASLQQRAFSGAL